MSTMPADQVGEHPEGCAELRAMAGTRCDEAHVSETAHQEAVQHVRDLRRDLVAAEHKQATAESAADPGPRRADKLVARQAYQRAARESTDAEAMAEAAAIWARAVDHINRSALIAQRELGKAQARVSELQQILHDAERAEQAARLQAETAESDCLDARVRLANCEERGLAPAGEGRSAGEEPDVVAGRLAVAISADGGEPLVIESMVSGDRRALELAADRIAEHAGLAPARARLQLQELVDAIVAVASNEGFLVFDTDHPFWSALTFEESRDVIGALARLGFQFEPAEGWHAGRAPSPLDLSMALAYAGLDARNMRGLPSAEDLRVLPQSISVDARALLAARAPELTVDHVVRLLERRAAQLEPLWDEWGQVRPILLGRRRDLGSLSG